jgi:hypothetical protein
MDDRFKGIRADWHCKCSTDTKSARRMTSSSRSLKTPLIYSQIASSPVVESGPWMSFLFVSQSLRLRNGSLILPQTVKHIPTWFPGAGFKRNAIKWKAMVEEFVDKPYEWTKSDIVRVVFSFLSHADSFLIQEKWICCTILLFNCP